MNATLLWIAASILGGARETPTKQERARVMVLAVYHFDAPNLDYVKGEKLDHRSESKQAEIAEVLDRLAAFAPTKVVLEAPPDAKQVQQRYEAFLSGTHVLAGNEREQLGFRIAKHFSHPRVFLADHASDMDIGAVLQAAQENGDERFIAWFKTAMEEAQGLMSKQTRLSVGDALLMLNEPALQDRSRDLYLQFARVKRSDSFVGADVLAKWYRRNFCIFGNIASAIDSPRDRVLVIFGQGHVAYLRELIRSSPDLELVEPNEYLGRK